MQYLSENGYREAMEQKVEPLLDGIRQSGVFGGCDGSELCYALYPANEPQGTVVVVHGFTESAAKFREMVYYFHAAGYTVLIYDQRGHGHSPRTAPADVTHVARFSEYVEDLHALVTSVGKDLPAPRFLFCHSMGGAVGALYLIRHGGYFDKAVLSSPMLAPKHDGISLFLARLICKVSVCFGKGKKRIFVSAPPVTPDLEKAEDSAGESRERYEYYRRLRMSDPALRGGAPTYGWTYESLGVTKDILKKGAPESVKIPVLLFSAKQDSLVQEQPQREFAARAPQCRFVSVDTKHEIYVSNDRILHPYLDELLSFLQAAF